MVIENNLSVDGINKFGFYFNFMIFIYSFVLENFYFFVIYLFLVLKKIN